MKNRGKAICFVDNSNIFSGQLSNGWRIDWTKFENKLEQSGSVWQTYFFASENDPPRAMQSDFYKALRNNLRWEVQIYDLGRKTTKCAICGNVDTVKAEKGVDIGLATKMLTLGVNKAYETAILVSGDKDYLDVVKFIKSLGLRVEIVGWKNSMSKDLAQESSLDVVYLDDIRSEIEKF